MRRSRITLLAALVAAASLAVPSSAAPTQLVIDPKGDARVLGDDFDIVSAHLTTTGTTKKVGRKTVYTPTALVASVTVVGAPSTQPGYTVNLIAKTSACDGGELSWTWRPGNEAFGESDLLVTGCGSSSVVPNGGLYVFRGADVSIAGHTVTWKTRIKEFQGDLPLGSIFTDFRAYVDQNEPVTNFYGTGIGHDGDLSKLGVSIDKLVTDTSVDTARSSAKYVLR